MDGTGAGTGQGTAPGEVADGPARPVGRADATGPLPAQAPADPTGPLPTPPSTPDSTPPGESWFAPADETAAQPVVQPVVPPPAAAEETGPQPAATPQSTAPSWFATGPLPVVPPSPEEVAAAAEATAPADLFTPAEAQNPPAGLFEPAGDAAPAPPAAAVEPPQQGLFAPATPPQAPAPPPAPAAPPTDLFAAPPPPPATGLFAAVTPADTPAPPADATGPMPALAAAPPQQVAPQQVASQPLAQPAAPQPVTPQQVAPQLIAPGVAPPPAAPEPPPAPEPVAPAPAFAPAPPPAAPPPPPAADHGQPDLRPRTPPAAPGHPTGITTVKAATPRTRRAWPLTVGGVLVAIAAGIALVFSVARTSPADLATTAASDAAAWPGVHYQGAVAAEDGGEIRVDLTVTPDGASGTLSRYGGQATAELLADGSGALIRGNREWWLYHHPTRADDLAGVWVAEPATETQEIGPALGLSGESLAAFVRGEEPERWQALEQQLVEGRSGIVLSDGSRRVVVGGEDAHPLIALDLAPGSGTAPLPVTSATEEQLAAVAGAAARVRQEAAPKTLDQLLKERPNVGIELRPDQPCTAETCNVTITVTNSGTAPARGRLEVTADGNVVATHPLDVPPGQVATFDASAPNPQFSQPGATGRILWETRAVDD